jgi:uncharacterized RDD family membrane protein YckC
MDETTPEPKKPDIPPPHIPVPEVKSQFIPPPDIKPVEPPPRAGVPVVNVRLRDGGAPPPTGPGGTSVPFNTRVAAAFIDCLLAIGLHIAAYWILPGFAEGLAFLAGVGYLVLRDSLPFPGRQSVGKKVMKIRVATMDDEDLTGNWVAACIRNGVLLIPFFALVELYVLLSREDGILRGRRLGDEWSKTKVVMAPDPPEEPDEAE